MSQANASTESGDVVAGAKRGEASTGRGLTTATRSVRRAVRSDALFGAVGAVSLVRGLRDLRRGDVGSGLVRLLAGGGFVAAALARRGTTDGDGSGGEALGGDRSPAVDQTDVVATGIDVEGVAARDAEGEAATGDEASDVVGSSVDIEAAAGTDRDEVSRASGDEAADVVDSSADVEDAADSGTELDSDVDAADVDQTDVVDTGIGETTDASDRSDEKE